jgi:hypothetical protein
VCVCVYVCVCIFAYHQRRLNSDFKTEADAEQF